MKKNLRAEEVGDELIIWDDELKSLARPIYQ
jgi:hypothetical protein